MIARLRFLIALMSISLLGVMALVVVPADQLGIDIAKNIFQLHGVNQNRSVI